MTTRDPETGELVMPISVDLHVEGQALPTIYSVRDWAGVARFFRSKEFKTLLPRIDFVTITDHRHGEERAA